MQSEKFMEVLNGLDTKSRNEGVTEEEIKNLMKEAKKVTTDSEEIRTKIYEKINSIRRRTSSLTKWDILMTDMKDLAKTKLKTNKEFKNVIGFLDEVENFRISPITNKEFKALKKTYKTVSSIAKNCLDSYMFSTFTNEIDKKMRMLENRTKRISNNNFNAWFKKIIKDQNISLKDLAEKSGISISYLYRLESTNEITPSNKMLEKLAKGLNIKVEDIPIGNKASDKENQTIKNSKKVNKVKATKKAKSTEITNSNIREKNRDLFEIISNENIQINKRTLNEDERAALKGCLMFLFDKNKNVSDMLRFFNQVEVLR